MDNTLDAPKSKKNNWFSRISAKTTKLTPYILVLPALVIVILFVIYPLIVGFYTSLTDQKVSTITQSNFVGLKNYILLLTTRGFYKAAGITFKFYGMSIVVEMGIGLCLALLLNHDIKGIRIYRSIFLIPFMVPPVASGLIWRNLLDPQGVINYILGSIGLTPIPWLAGTKTVLFALLVIDSWATIPQVTILLLAGLKNISSEILDAANIDGAGSLNLFRYITWPMILPYFLSSLLIRSIELLQILDIIMSTSKGGPAGASTVLQIDIYNEVFYSGLIGSGNAYAWLLAIIVMLVVAIISLLISKTQSSYYGE